MSAFTGTTTITCCMPAPGERCDALGQSAPLVLALTISVHYGMDGGKPFHRSPYRALRSRAVDGGDCLLLAPAGDHPCPRAETRSLKKAIGRDWKGKLSPMLYIIAIVATLRSVWLAQAILVIAALIWLIPDRRIEKRLVM